MNNKSCEQEELGKVIIKSIYIDFYDYWYAVATTEDGVVIGNYISPTIECSKIDMTKKYMLYDYFEYFPNSFELEIFFNGEILAKAIRFVDNEPEDFEIFVCNRLGNLRPIDYVCLDNKKHYDYLSKKLYDNNPIEKAEEEFYESLSEKFIVIRH